MDKIYSKIIISEKNPIVRCYVSGERLLAEDIGIIYNDFRFIVPKNFNADGSSIPRIFWRVLGSPTTGPNLLAGIVHDYLYSGKIFSRKFCDQIFYEILLELEKPKLLAWCMFKAVRAFGGSHYK